MILVTGATGNVGSHAVRLLSEAGQPVRVLVRDPDRLSTTSGVDVVVGNLTDRSALDRAVDGVDTIVLVSPPSREGELGVVDAAAGAGVGHVVKISSTASADSPVERRRDQSAIEAHLAASGLPHTILRANVYLQNLLALAPAVRASDSFVMSTGDGRLGLTDARDVAASAVAVALDPSAHVGAVYWPTGPAELTYDDVADELSDVVGRSIAYRRVTPGEHRDLMVAAGVPEPVARSNAQAFELVADGDAAWTTDDVRTLTGRDPRTLRDFLREHAETFGA